MIRDFEPRIYQQSIFATCASKNTLVVLPTGLGKTNIFLMVAAHRLSLYPDKKILFIGPTRPLIDQYHLVFARHFEIDPGKMCVLTGMVSPEKRAQLWDSSSIIFSTPQGLENDIITRRVTFKEVCLLGVDEAHRAVGDYSYVWIARQYLENAEFPRLVALTASPGTDSEGVAEVCRNLGIEAIESRTYEDNDVRPYVQDIEFQAVEVELTRDLLDVRALLESCLKSRIEKLRNWRLLSSSRPSKKELIETQGMVSGRIASGEKDPFLWTAVSVAAESLKVFHAVELVESQGISSVQKYFERMLAPGVRRSRALRSLESDHDFVTAVQKVKVLFEQGVEHPKLARLVEMLKRESAGNSDLKVIVFTQYRDSASKIVSEIVKAGISSRVFVGQAKKGDSGMSQKEQKSMLDDFREGAFSVLCATSIGEEGLDIPRVDLVVFYEPVPSAIRHIQRRGRTGRQEKGRVVVMVAKGTRDVSFRWIAQRKEKGMKYAIGKVQAGLEQSVKQAASPRPSMGLDRFIRPTLYVDSREQASQVVKELSESADIVMQRLDVADYVCSSRVGIEVKDSQDFVASIIDGRLLSQLRDLRSSFERPVIILEEDSDLYSVRNVSPAAVRGMLATIAVSYGIPMIRSRNKSDTAGIILAIARREQEEGAQAYSPHKAKPASLREMQEYIVGSFPNIGPAAARPLLSHFGSIKSIVNASEEELKSVDLVGDRKAKELRRVFDSQYQQ